MSVMASQITGVSAVCLTVCLGTDQRKQTSKLCVTGLCEAGDRWIPLTKGQWRRKYFHLMTSSWWGKSGVSVASTWDSMTDIKNVLFQQDGIFIIQWLAASELVISESGLLMQLVPPQWCTSKHYERLWPVIESYCQTLHFFMLTKTNGCYTVCQGAGFMESMGHCNLYRGVGEKFSWMPCHKCSCLQQCVSKCHDILGGGWGCEVSCGGHQRQSGKTTAGSALDGAVLDFIQILAYLVHNMSRSQLYLGFGHFGWLPSFFRPITFWRVYGSIVFHLLKLLSFFWLTYYCSIGPCFSVRV